MGTISKKVGRGLVKSYYDLVKHSGNQELFRAVEMSIAALTHGYPFHIHAEGLRGTGKTTVMRAAKEILPPIVRIKGCIYNCHPANPHCPEHKELRPEQIARIGTETIPCPFLEISHAAKLGTVVGSIDLSKLTDRLNPVAALLPGTIPQAHRGIIFIDEINRLADTAPELADVLLAVMGTKPGRIQIEESGIPVVNMPITVTIWAASNPDEEPGALTQVRRQLADRFDVMIPMGRPNDYQAVTMILNKNRRGEDSSDLKAVLRNMTLNLDTVRSDDKIRRALASVYVDFGLESLRAIEAVETGARLNALLAGREKVVFSDVLNIVPLALGHRTDNGTITNILKYLESLERGDNADPIEAGYRENERNTEAGQASVQGKVSNDAWWSRLWRNLKSRFAVRKRRNSHSTDSQSKKNSTVNQCSTAAGGPQNSPADPMQTEINAPAKPAAPLSSMKIDQFVTDGEKRSNA
jgi:magnesium chelatase subunit I